jgi:hypothetical protein
MSDTPEIADQATTATPAPGSMLGALNLGAPAPNIFFSAPGRGISAGPTTASDSSGLLLMAGICPGTGKTPGQPFPFS